MLMFLFAISFINLRHVTVLWLSFCLSVCLLNRNLENSDFNGYTYCTNAKISEDRRVKCKRL